MNSSFTWEHKCFGHFVLSEICNILKVSMLVPSGDSNVIQHVVLGLLDQNNLCPQMFICVMNHCHMIQKGFIKETLCTETVFVSILCI
jgi:hypothetical protein